MAEEPKSITRRDLPAIVKRAAELAAVDDDAGDRISEDEVLRIASELGLSPRHVKQALFEGVPDQAEPTLLDRQLGPPRFVVTRAVPMDAPKAQKALEEYLVTCEYLVVVRRQGNSVTLQPAPDTFSKLARAFKRSSKHLLASSQAVEFAVEPLESGWSNVRLRAVFEDDRRSRVVKTIVLSTLLGLPVGVLAVGIVGGLASGLLGMLSRTDVTQPIAVGLGVMAGLAGIWGIVSAGLLSMRKRYRQWRERTLMQVEGILDELEKGNDLRPPPPPWMRKMKMKFTDH
jgi:hypothetical protein